MSAEEIQAYAVGGCLGCVYSRVIPQIWSAC